MGWRIWDVAAGRIPRWAGGFGMEMEDSGCQRERRILDGDEGCGMEEAGGLWDLGWRVWGEDVGLGSG